MLGDLARGLSDLKMQAYKGEGAGEEKENSEKKNEEWWGWEVGRHGLMLIFYLHCNSSLDLTCLLQVQWDFYIGTCLYVAYFCKTGNAGLASRNIVPLQKIILRCVGFCFCILHLYVKPIRSLLIQRIPAGSSFRLLA